MLVGRDSEKTAIARLLESARDRRSGALVIRGEAGLGKSALLDHTAKRADGFTVLRGNGVDAESELAYAALHQILRSVFDRIDRLPEPQAAALRAAFALSTETVDERFRVSLGVLGLLSEVAEEGPLLCLVDDAQWLDKASADSLVFAARRFEAESIALVLATRDDDSRTFEGHGLPELCLSPLDGSDSRALLSTQHGSTVAPGVVEWLVENAGGNPLALLELPRALTPRQLAGQDPLDAALPPATSVEQLYVRRVDDLAPAARAVVVLAAAEDLGTRSTIERAAAELGLDIAELTAAERAGLLRVTNQQVVFRHPLIRTALYRDSAFTERERAHRALAEASIEEGSPDRAAWHRAAATIGTDEDVSRELENTAERARARGGHSAAATALERASDLTSDEVRKGRLLVAAAGEAWHAGQPERASGLLDFASLSVQGDDLRAELAHVRGRIELECGNLLEASEKLLDGAAQIAQSRPRKALEMLADGGVVAVKIGDFERLADVGRRVATLPDSGDPSEVLLADLVVGVGSLFEGRTADAVPVIADAIARAATFHDSRLLYWAALGASAVGDERTEGELLRHSVAIARESVAVDTLVLMLELVVTSAGVAGRYTVDAEATEGVRLAREAGLTNAASAHLAALAWIAALRGREEECIAYATEVRQSAWKNNVADACSTAEWAVALLELSRGQPDAAAARLLALRAAPVGIAHPFVVLVSTPDLVEGCVRAGRLEEALDAFRVLDGFAQAEAPPWALALAARSRGLLSGGADAEQHFDEAIELHSDVNRPFDRARTELLFGEHLRRDRQRRKARVYLRAAFETFDALGAPRWAARAGAELRASGETARKRDPSTLGELTPQERQIAQLVGDGRSNKEIAAQLFLSPRTIDYHLRKVFMKLGISSRAEVVRLELDGAETPPKAAIVVP
jgi:DNA-binding CsgD family transcriptional regulator